MSAGVAPCPLRILFLYETLYPDFMGGVEVRNHELARALAARGHRVTLAGFSNSEPSTPPGVQGLLLGPRLDLYAGRRRSIAHALRLARAVIRLDLDAYDVIETASVPFAHLPPLAARCAALGKPLLVTWYEHWGRYWRSYAGKGLGLVYQTIEALSARLGTAVLFTSELTGRRLRAARRRRGVESLGCGVDFERASRAVEASARSGPPLVFVGRLMPHKRLDLLLQAVAKLRPRTDGCALLTILGDGPDRERLERLVMDLGVSDRVRLVRRLETSDDVYALLASARVAVQPSAREGFGLFPLEALAAGLPVVSCASPDSAVGELVRDGVEGIAVPADRDALAAALERLLDDEATLTRMSHSARQRAAEFDWAKIAARFEDLARGVTGS